MDYVLSSQLSDIIASVQLRYDWALPERHLDMQLMRLDTEATFRTERRTNNKPNSNTLTKQLERLARALDGENFQHYGRRTWITARKER